MLVLQTESCGAGAFFVPQEIMSCEIKTLEKYKFAVDFCRRMEYDICRAGDTGNCPVQKNKMRALSSVGRAVDS